MRRISAIAVILALALSACANGDDVEETEDDVEEIEDEGEANGYSVDDQPDAQASFESPQDGDTVSETFTVELAAEGVDLVEAGAPEVGEAHLHVLADIGCYDTGEVIPGPSDEDEAEGRFHLGDGSDSREIELEPGTYELCVQLGDGAHIAFGDTETITVTVE